MNHSSTGRGLCGDVRKDTEKAFLEGVKHKEVKAGTVAGCVARPTLRDMINWHVDVSQRYNKVETPSTDAAATRDPSGESDTVKACAAYGFQLEGVDSGGRRP